MQKNLALWLNRAVNALPRPMRRFLLDRLVPGALKRRLAATAKAVVDLRSGARMVVSPLFHGGFLGTGAEDYEVERRAALLRLLPEGGCLWDIGANVGIFSLDAAAARRARVLMVEPEENNLACLRQSLEENPGLSLELRQLAVGREPGRMTFDRRGGAFSGRLVGAGERSVGETVEVEVATLDGLRAGGAARPDLVKIDVEGGEGAVLAGGPQLLSQDRPILFVELHWNHGDGAGEALGLLTDGGYRFEDDQGAPLSPDEVAEGQIDFVVAIPELDEAEAET